MVRNGAIRCDERAARRQAASRARREDLAEGTGLARDFEAVVWWKVALEGTRDSVAGSTTPRGYKPGEEIFCPVRDLDGHLAAIDERIDSKHEHPAILDRPRRFLRVKAEIEVSSCDRRLCVDVKRHRNQEQDNEDNGDHLLQEQRARTDLVAGVLGRPLGALDGKVEVDQDPKGKGELERRDADEPECCEGHCED